MNAEKAQDKRNIKIGKQCAIFCNIDSEKFTNEEKALAIYDVLKMPTHLSITKDSMIKVIKWLWDQLYEIKEVVEE